MHYVIRFFFFHYSVLDTWDIYRGLFMRIKRRIHLSESQPHNCKEAHIHCSLNDNLFQTRPGYKLTISNHRIKILASDTTGLRHAISTLIQVILNFIYSEKATKFCEISTLLLSEVHTDKSKVEISQNFVAFSEYMNFN